MLNFDERVVRMTNAGISIDDIDSMIVSLPTGSMLTRTFHDLRDSDGRYFDSYVVLGTRRVQDIYGQIRIPVTLHAHHYVLDYGDGFFERDDMPPMIFDIWLHLYRDEMFDADVLTPGVEWNIYYADVEART